MPAIYTFHYTFLNFKKLFSQDCFALHMENHKQNTLTMQQLPSGEQVAQSDWLLAFFSQHLIYEKNLGLMTCVPPWLRTVIFTITRNS